MLPSEPCTRITARNSFIPQPGTERVDTTIPSPAFASFHSSAPSAPRSIDGIARSRAMKGAILLKIGSRETPVGGVANLFPSGGRGCPSRPTGSSEKVMTAVANLILLDRRRGCLAIAARCDDTPHAPPRGGDATNQSRSPRNNPEFKHEPAASVGVIEAGRTHVRLSMAHKLTTCTFCGTGCGIYLETAGDRVIGAYPSMSHPTNEGRICVRGWHVHEVAGSPDRLTAPVIRRNGRLEETTWEVALEFIVSRLREIRSRHGADSIAFLNTPRCSNEEAYLLQKLARAVFGTNNVDHGAGVYGHNSINVLLDMLGVPATTTSDRKSVV